VGHLWRYPVKSLRGEGISEAIVGLDGVEGDRLVHVRERGGRVVTSRYRPRLLGLGATLGPDGEPLIEGRPCDAAESLAAVRAASAPDVELVRFREPDRGQRHDVLPLTVLTDGMVGALGYDHRRFRPNIFVSGVAGLTEREWAGRALRIGTALIGVRRPRSRCVMSRCPTRAADGATAGGAHAFPAGPALLLPRLGGDCRLRPSPADAPR